jgi:uncharacterized membrane protein (UPF0127 family)
MKSKKIILILIILVIFTSIVSLFFIFSKDKSSKQDLNINFVKINSQVIKVDVADNAKSQEKGLSGREKLEENTGMLFVFKNSGVYPFWMKDMKFSIDIIWLDEAGKIIFIKKNVSPDTFPETFSPEKNSRYVLELSAGFSEKNNLQEGNFVEFLP